MHASKGTCQESQEEDQDGGGCIRWMPILGCNWVIPTIHWQSWFDAKIVDQFLHKTWMVHIKSKAQIAEMVKQYLNTMCSQGKQVKCLCWNNANEHGVKLANICKEGGIKIEFMAPYTPQHNGIAKCNIVTDCDCAIAMLFGARLTKTAQGCSKPKLRPWWHIFPTWFGINKS